jgi:ankyrin repeat protein
VKHGYSDISTILLKHGVDAKCLDNNGDSCLHLAATKGHLNILEYLLKHDITLLGLANPYNGYYPLHSAAFALQVECAAKLIEHGADVTQLTVVGVTDKVTALHLGSKQLAFERMKHGGCWHEEDYPEKEGVSKERTHAMLDLLMANLPPVVDVVVDSELGSILHYFAAVDYAAGIRRLAASPYCHPPDLENRDGQSPYSLAVKSNSFAVILQLLELEVKMDSSVWTTLQLFLRKWLTNDNKKEAKEDIARVIIKLVEKG